MSEMSIRECSADSDLSSTSFNSSFTCGSQGTLTASRVRWPTVATSAQTWTSLLRLAPLRPAVSSSNSLSTTVSTSRVPGAMVSAGQASIFEWHLTHHFYLFPVSKHMQKGQNSQELSELLLKLQRVHTPHSQSVQAPAVRPQLSSGLRLPQMGTLLTWSQNL